MTRSVRRVTAFAGAVGLILLGALLFACDQVYADPVTTPFSSFSTILDSGLTSKRIPPVPCPPKVNENGPCSRLSAVCEVGESADPKCNSTFVCTNDSSYGLYWTEQSTPQCAGECPDPSTIVDGAPCAIPDAGADEAELQCMTETATCACTTGPDGAHAHPRRWVCVKPDVDCPTKRPLLGQACFGEHKCDYGACDFKRGAQMICEDEVWQIEAAQCQ